tara:strand:+ start:1095 stop:1541 length:447 start_codon:yes stop_codon:yes gene_type:complete
LLKSLKNIFANSEDSSNEESSENHLNLLAGLMLEAASTDGKIDQVEINRISESLVEIFKENKVEVDLVLQKLLKELDTPKSLYFFTSKLNKVFSDEKKTLLIETLWDIILSDGKEHEYESNLIRRLAGLLYISDVSCGNAKKRALAKI